MSTYNEDYTKIPDEELLLSPDLHKKRNFFMENKITIIVTVITTLVLGGLFTFIIIMALRSYHSHKSTHPLLGKSYSYISVTLTEGYISEMGYVNARDVDTKSSHFQTFGDFVQIAWPVRVNGFILESLFESDFEEWNDNRVVLNTLENIYIFKDEKLLEKARSTRYNIPHLLKLNSFEIVSKSDISKVSFPFQIPNPNDSCRKLKQSCSVYELTEVDTGAKSFIFQRNGDIEIEWSFEYDYLILFNKGGDDSPTQYVGRSISYWFNKYEPFVSHSANDIEHLLNNFFKIASENNDVVLLTRYEETVKVNEIIEKNLIKSKSTKPEAINPRRTNIVCIFFQGFGDNDTGKDMVQLINVTDQMHHNNKNTVQLPFLGSFPACGQVFYFSYNSVQNSFDNPTLQENLYRKYVEVVNQDYRQCKERCNDVYDTLLIGFSFGNNVAGQFYKNSLMSKKRNPTNLRLLNFASPTNGSAASNYLGTEICSKIADHAKLEVDIMEILTSLSGYCYLDFKEKSFLLVPALESITSEYIGHKGINTEVANNSSGLLCSTNGHGIHTMDELQVIIVSLATHMNVRNDGMVDFDDCRFSIPEGNFSDIPNSQFYRSRFSHTNNYPTTYLPTISDTTLQPHTFSRIRSSIILYEMEKNESINK